MFLYGVNIGGHSAVSLFGPFAPFPPQTAPSFVVVVELQQLIAVTSPTGDGQWGEGEDGCAASRPITSGLEACHQPT